VTAMPHRSYVAALDLGTTSSRCIVFDQTGSPIGVAQRDHRQILPQPGWVEHDPLEIKARVAEIAQGALAAAGVAPSELAAVGITNQRETTVVWDRATGRPSAMPSSGRTRERRASATSSRVTADRTGCGRRLGCRWRPTSRPEDTLDPGQRARCQGSRRGR